MTVIRADTMYLDYIINSIAGYCVIFVNAKKLKKKWKQKTPLVFTATHSSLQECDKTHRNSTSQHTHTPQKHSNTILLANKRIPSDATRAEKTGTDKYASCFLFYCPPYMMRLFFTCPILLQTQIMNFLEEWNNNAQQIYIQSMNDKKKLNKKKKKE